MTGRAFVVALLGAESTGKTTLASTLAAAFAARGRRVAVVGEYLREFCDAQGRTPRRDEQRAIGAEQTRRIEAAAADSAGADLVIADTTALTIAVYSDLLFDDRSLYAEAIAAQRRFDLALLAANDLPWLADGLQRDGPQVRGPVAAKLQAALGAAGIAWLPIAGSGAARGAAAIAAVASALAAGPAGGR